MKKHKKVALAGIVLFLALLGAWFFPKKYYDVRLDGQGFSPRELTIPIGATVRFATTTGENFWPASNFHPSHRLYPEFDAKEPVAATASWSFVFNTPGTWRYHDHLNSTHTGTILVKEPLFSKSQNPCNESNINTLHIGVQERCWIQKIEHVLRHKGVDAAFEVFGKLYDSESAFPSDCHDVTHLLGEAAYRAYLKDGKVVDSVKTSYCGYGFYHGFIEALLFTTGNFDQAKSYCREVQKKLSEHVVSPNAIYSCYHGIGHGTFDTQSFSQWGNDIGMLETALSICEQVTQGDEPELVKQCATGVFNGLANAYNNKTYNLTFNPSDPWGVCERQDAIEYKKACFREVSASYIKGLAEGRSAALKMIAKIPDRVGAAAAMYAYMSEEARLNIDIMSLESFAQICEDLLLGDLRSSCVEGVATGLFLWGKPGHEHEKALAFCGNERLSLPQKDVCFAYVLPRIRSVYTTKKVREVCEAMERKYEKYCL